jgi:hypothetical protein
MCEPGVVKTPTVEIGPVVSFEERTIVVEIEPVPVVTVPGGVVIISIAGEFGFTDSGICIVSACIYRSGSDIAAINYGCGSDKGPANNGESDAYMPESDACANASADINLGIAFASDEAGGYNRCEDK